MHSKKLWAVVGALAFAAATLVSYHFLRSPPSQAMRHPLTGYVLEVRPAESTITVRNDDMPGVMHSMVMDYRVKDATALSQIKPGDAIQATMVMDDSYWLENIKVTGTH